MNQSPSSSSRAAARTGRSPATRLLLAGIGLVVVFVIAVATRPSGPQPTRVTQAPPASPVAPATPGGTQGASPAGSAPTAGTPSVPVGAAAAPGATTASQAGGPAASPAAGASPTTPAGPTIPGLPPDHPPITADDPNQISIQWLGHACFYIHSPKGITVVTDPFDSEKVGMATPGTGAHFVTVTSADPAHNEVEAVHAFEGDARQTLFGTGAVRDDVRVDALPLGTDSAGKARYGYRILAGPMRIVHLGGLTRPLSAAQLQGIGEADILMLPVGGETISPKDAAAIAVSLKPRVVLPMAYRPPSVDPTGPGLVSRLRPLEGFVKHTPFAVSPRDTDIMLLSQRDLPPATEVFTLRYGH